MLKKLQLTWKRLPPVPDPEGFAAPFTGVVGDRLLVAGGANFPAARPWDGGIKQWYDTVYMLESPEGQWRDVGRLPRPNAYGVSANSPDGVICVGGGDAREHFAESFILGWSGTGLVRSSLRALPQPCAFMSGTVAGGVLYLAGGISSPNATEALGVFWALDLSAPAKGWRELAPCPGPPRMLAVAGASGEAFFLLSGVSLAPDDGGKAVRTYLRDAYAYRPASGWSRLADLPRPAVAAPSPAPNTRDGRLLVLGGDDGTRVHLNGPSHPGFPRQILCYEPEADHWTDEGSMPFSHATVPTTRWRGHAIIPNGERIPGYRTPEVWALKE